MTAEKKTLDLSQNLTSAADEAAKEEATAKQEKDVGVYTHIFPSPFQYQGSIVEQLTFDWKLLTGADHLAIESELLAHGKTLVTPEFSSDFLCGMAIRACNARDEKGLRIVTTDFMKALPMRDFQGICKRARSFLLRAGS